MARRRSGMEETAPAWLGLDCGGTRSVAAYECGSTRLRADAGPGNLRLLSDANLLALFKTLSSVHKGLPDPAVVTIGMASARLDSDRARIRRFAEKVWPRSTIVPTDDLQTALAAAELDARKRNAAAFDAIIIVLAGTGSCFFGKDATGKSVKVGGWGHILGDEGSAYSIGQLAMRAMVWDYDTQGVVSPLGARLLRALMLNKPEEVSAWAVNATKTDVGALATEVALAATQGDATARQILDQAADVIAAQALRCAARLVKPQQRVRFVFAGSVLTKNSLVAKRVQKTISEQRKCSDFAVLEIESAWGAVELSRRHAGAPDASVLSSSHPSAPNEASGLSRLDLNLAASPTEQRNPRSLELDQLSTREAIALMLSEDARIPKAVLAKANEIEQAVDWIAAAFKKEGRLFYVGAGTSGRLGVLDASECPPTFRTDPEMVQGIIAGGHTALWKAVEGAEDSPDEGAGAIASRGVTKRDVVVGIAASGRTPFVWGALQEARSRGAKTILLTFNPRLEIPTELKPSLVIAIDVGPEVLTGSTRLKSGTATKLVLNIFTTIAMVRIGKVLSNLMIDVKPTNVKLRDRAVRIVTTLTSAAPAEAKEALDRSSWDVKKAVEQLRRGD